MSVAPSPSASSARPDAKLVAAECGRRIADLVRWLGLYPDHLRNGCYQPVNPVRADRSPGSFVVYGPGHPKAGGWVDYTDPDHLKGDALDLVGYVKFGPAFSRKDAYKAALRFLGWETADLTLPERYKAAQQRLAADRDAAQQRQADKLAEDRKQAFARWLKATPLERAGAAPALVYLKHRGLDLFALPELPGAVRFDPAAWHKESNAKHPALRTLITGPDGSPWAVHTTFLAPGGQGKAAINPARKIWPGGFWGGAIRLTKGHSGLRPKEAAEQGVEDTLVLGEGIETCLSVAAAVPEWRVWAAGSLGALGAVEFPGSTRKVVVLAENDQAKPGAAGEEAAGRWLRTLQKLGRRCSAAGVPLFVARPAEGDKDFNDTARRLAAKPAEATP